MQAVRRKNDSFRAFHKGDSVELDDGFKPFSPSLQGPGYQARAAFWSFGRTPPDTHTEEPSEKAPAVQTQNAATPELSRPIIDQPWFGSVEPESDRGAKPDVHLGRPVADAHGEVPTDSLPQRGISLGEHTSLTDLQSDIAGEVSPVLQPTTAELRIDNDASNEIIPDRATIAVEMFNVELRNFQEYLQNGLIDEISRHIVDVIKPLVEARYWEKAVAYLRQELRDRLIQTPHMPVRIYCPQVICGLLTESLPSDFLETVNLEISASEDDIRIEIGESVLKTRFAEISAVFAKAFSHD